jgi:hypothetical protein
VEEHIIHPAEYYSKPRIEPYKVTISQKRRCSKCHGLASVHIPEGHDGSVWLYRCESCFYVSIPEHFFPIEPKSQPLGSPDKDALRKPAIFHNAITRRNPSMGKRSRSSGGRTINRNQVFVPTEDPVPLLAGKPDRELESLCERGILLSCIDSNAEVDSE